MSVDEYVKKTGKQYPLRAGYFIGPCPYCGQRVVKSIKTGQAGHVHRRSKKCREAVAAHSAGIEVHALLEKEMRCEK